LICHVSVDPAPLREWDDDAPPVWHLPHHDVVGDQRDKILSTAL